MTPAVSITHTSGSVYSLEKTAVTSAEIDSVEFIFLDSNDNPTNSVYTATLSTVTSTTYSVTADTNLAAGKYLVRAHSNSNGFAVSTPATITVAFPSTPTASAISSSFVGGKELVISGAGFVTENI